MSINVMELLTSQLKNLNLPQDQMGNIMNQASEMGLGQKNVSAEEAQPMIAGLLGQNGVSTDMIGQVVANVMKDGFQLSDITDVAGNMIAQQAVSKVTGGNTDLLSKAGEMLGGLFGKK